MYPDSEPQETAAYQERDPRVVSGGMLRQSVRGQGLRAGTNSGLMGMTEAEFTALENLKQNLSILEEKLQPLLEPMPEETDGNKMAEPNMNKATGRLMAIINLTMELNRKVERLNREVNL